MTETASIGNLTNYDYSCDAQEECDVVTWSVYPLRDSIVSTSNDCIKNDTAGPQFVDILVANKCFKYGDTYRMIRCEDGTGQSYDYSNSDCTMDETISNMFETCKDDGYYYETSCNEDSGVSHYSLHFLSMVLIAKVIIYSN